MKIDATYSQKMLDLQDKFTNKEHQESSFSDILKNSLYKVNNLQHNANQAGEDLALGKVDNVHQVMITAQKAKLSLDLTTSITTKAIDAYKEVMRMQV